MSHLTRFFGVWGGACRASPFLVTVQVSGMHKMQLMVAWWVYWIDCSLLLVKSDDIKSEKWPRIPSSYGEKIPHFGIFCWCKWHSDIPFVTLNASRTKNPVSCRGLGIYMILLCLCWGMYVQKQLGLAGAECIFVDEVYHGISKCQWILQSFSMIFFRQLNKGATEITEIFGIHVGLISWYFQKAAIGAPQASGILGSNAQVYATWSPLDMIDEILGWEFQCSKKTWQNHFCKAVVSKQKGWCLLNQKHKQITTTSTDRAVRGAGAADGDIDVAKPGMAEQLGSLQLDETALESDSISWNFVLLRCWYFEKFRDVFLMFFIQWLFDARKYTSKKILSTDTAAWEVLKCCRLWQRHGALHWRAGGDGVDAGWRHCWMSQEERSLKCREDRKLSYAFRIGKKKHRLELKIYKFA